MKRAAILYLPVIHAGHLKFCANQKPDKLFILGQSIIDTLPSLERDIRRVDPILVVKEALAIKLAPEVGILDKSNLNELEDRNSEYLNQAFIQEGSENEQENYEELNAPRGEASIAIPFQFINFSK